MEATYYPLVSVFIFFQCLYQILNHPSTSLQAFLFHTLYQFGMVYLPRHADLPSIIHPFYYQTSIGLIFLWLPFLLITFLKPMNFQFLLYNLSIKYKYVYLYLFFNNLNEI